MCERLLNVVSNRLRPMRWSLHPRVSTVDPLLNSSKPRLPASMNESRYKTQPLIRRHLKGERDVDSLTGARRVMIAGAGAVTWMALA